MVVQHVARDPEQEPAEAALAAEPLLSFETAEEGPLDQLLDVAVDLVAEEAGDRREVTGEQGLAGRLIAAPPGREQLRIAGVRHGCLP
ncbi:hypothetical protein [Nannocystis pusilla]|uniref:hypothetical protein n=1 Tax=Nannocystis pusilla TaxID=889268 RepID=UPI003DA2C1D0